MPIYWKIKMKEGQKKKFNAERATGLKSNDSRYFEKKIASWAAHFANVHSVLLTGVNHIKWHLVENS